jgi:hypothetical protein
MTEEDDADLLRAAERALSDLHVERDDVPDGRYVLYFSWPANGDAPREQPEATDDV